MKYSLICFGKHLLLLSLLMVAAKYAAGQTVVTELNRQLYYENREYPLHSSFKPYIGNSTYFSDIAPKKEKSKVGNALFYNNFLGYNNGKGVNFSINPLMNFEGGRITGNPAYSGENFYINTRGFKAEGNLGEKFTFYTSFYENQSRYLPYVSAHVKETKASVGMGRTKAFKVDGYDYAMATGMIVYRPIKPLEIWFGNGKNFIGSGYRSLFLSDNTASYPNLKVNVKLLNDKLHYTFVFASLLSSERLKQYSTGEPALYRKGANFNYLSYTPSPKFEIGLFESIIWRRFENGRLQSPNALQFNPVILTNALSQGLDDSKNNASLGLNLVWKPVSSAAVYGQLLYDGKSKNGFQAGVLKRDLLVKNLYMQVEVNKISRNTYTSTDSLSNYTNLWQGLAHPMGAAFTEGLVIINYRYKRFVADIQAVAAKIDQAYGTPGQDLVYSSSAIATGTKANYFYARPTLGFIINPTINLQLKAGAQLRKLHSEVQNDNTSYIFVGLSTNLNNLYFDF